jgi:uncharacterized protein YhjY with autotransporter beta-barrel domain
MVSPRRFSLELSLCALVLVGPCGLAQTAPLPARFDLRNVDGHSYIGPVRDQGAWGVCYAFAANAAAESAYNRATGRYDAAAADFSEAFVVWGLGPLYDDHFGENGADYTYSELRGLVDHGVCGEAEFPFPATAPSADALHWDAPRVKFSSWHRLPAYDIETMKRALATFGAVDVGILAGYEFDYHVGGVYDDSYHAADYVLEAYSSVNHAVAIVGWDDAPPEGGDGAWIVRNSWSADWGEAGHIRMDYHAAAIALSPTYLVYGDWSGEDFDVRLTEDVSATSAQAGGITTGYGFYAWGGNNASLTNVAGVSAYAEAASGDVLTHGLFVWGGARASLDNQGTVRSRVSATDGMGTAYGLCLQGHSLTNSGVVRARADGIDQRVTAYGVRYFAFDATGLFDNSGRVIAQANGDDAWAYGVYIDDAARVTNSGHVEAVGAGAAAGMVAHGVGTVRNSGSIGAWGGSALSYGLWLSGGRLENTESGTIAAYADADMACGLYAMNAAVHNDGTISGGFSVIWDGTLSGTGRFVGHLGLGNCTVAPGSSGIGALTVSGDFSSTGTFGMEVEIGSGGYDRIVVGGTATIEDENAKLTIIPVGYAAAGEYAFIAAESAEGTFASVTAPAVFDGSVRAGDGGFTLSLVRHSYADFAANAGLAPLARALDRVRPTAAGGVAAMLDGFDTDPDGAAIRAALPQLRPEINASASAAALEGVHRTGVLLTSQARPRSASSVNRGMAWFGALDGREKHGATGEFRAVDVNTDGGMAGVDYSLGTRFTVGAALADVRESVRERTTTDRADSDAQRGYLRARWDERPGAAGWHAAAHLGFGSTRIETRRRVDFLETDVEGAHRAWDLSAAVGGGRDFVYRRWTLRPFAEAEYVRLNELAYTERGSSGAELVFARRRTESLLAGAGLAVGTQFELGGIVLQPELRLRRARELCGAAGDLMAAFAGGDIFASPSRDYSRDRTEVAGSLSAKLAERIAFSVFASRTDFGGGDDFSQELGCRVQIAF